MQSSTAEPWAPTAVNDAHSRVVPALFRHVPWRFDNSLKQSHLRLYAHLDPFLIRTLIQWFGILSVLFLHPHGIEQREGPLTCQVSDVSFHLRTMLSRRSLSHVRKCGSEEVLWKARCVFSTPGTEQVEIMFC